MADDEDIEPLVCDNGTGMVNVLVSRVWGVSYVLYILPFGPNSIQHTVQSSSSPIVTNSRGAPVPLPFSTHWTTTL